MYLGTNQERLCTAKEVAEHYKISRNHLVKVVHNLALLGYIKSTKGKGGGICLMKEPEEINLRDIIIKIEPTTLVECFNKETNSCRIIDTCSLKHIFYESQQSFYNTLGKHTLADTIQKLKPFFLPK